MGLPEAIVWVLVVISASGPCVTRSAGLPCVHTINTTCSMEDSLSKALGAAQALKTSVCITLSSEHCSLDSALNTTMSHMSFLTIAGMRNTVVRCNQSNNVGLSFLNSVNIALVNVSFEHCGAWHNSTSRNFSVQTLAYLQSSSALFFLFCSNVTMTGVTVSHAVGSGLVMYNTIGLNIFGNCTFQYSRLVNGPGGAGVMIDFSYCVPGNAYCTSEALQNIGSHYVFRESTFYSNNGTCTEQAPLYSHGSDHMAFGKGGGVSISFGGQSIRNVIEFDACKFKLNSANSGLGLYASFGDTSINNSLIVTNSKFDSNIPDNFPKFINSCAQFGDPQFAGGGAKIDFIYYPPDPLLWPEYTSNVQGNKVEFIGSSFSGNTACFGGAVSLVTSRVPSGANSNELSFDSCQFMNNVGRLSSAVDLSLHYPDLVGHPGEPVQPLFTNCTFEGNHLKMGNINHYWLGMGALFTARVPFRLAGHTKFANNVGTAVVVLSTYVSATDSSLTEFTGNTGRLGGAVAFIGNAWLVTHDNSSFCFSNNLVKAGGLGGAIYSVHFGEHDFRQNCFFQYHKPTIPPSDWPVNFTFTNNSADGNSNSIYTTSIQPCKWQLSPGVFTEGLCGHPWYFSNSNCSQQVSTASSTLRVPPIHIQAVPGWSTSLNVTGIDDYGKHTSTVLVPYPNESDISKIKVSNKTKYISNDQIILYGIENQTLPMPLLKLRTPDPRVIESELGVAILSCPPGFIPHPCADQTEMTCNCVCPNDTTGITCDLDSHNVTLHPYYCLTYQYENDKLTPNKSKHPVLGECPYNDRHIPLPRIADDLDDIVCGPYHRTGLLCSACRENYSVGINSHNYECVPCNPSTGWIVYLAARILPVTVLFLLIALLNFKATSPAMNAFVFYGQIVSIAYFHNPYPFFFGILELDKSTHDVLIALVEFFYGILNLDFFRRIVPPFCVGNINTLTAIALKYIVSLYPLLLIGVLCTFIKLYDRDVWVLRAMWRPFKWCLTKLHQKKKPTTSIVDAIATFILFSFTNFMCVSFPLLYQVRVLDARSTSHTPIVDWQSKFYFDATLDWFGNVPSVLMFATVTFLIAVFVVVPPLFLILYPLKCMQRCISKLPKNIAIKTFAESFNECYRNGTERKGAWDYRYFAGLYFLFRIVILAIFMASLKWLEQYVIQQVFFTLVMLLFAIARPYKKDVYNVLDSCMFALLALQNALSFYNSQKESISLPVFIINYILLFVPLLYLLTCAICYCLVSPRCLSKWYRKESNLSESIVIISEATQNSSYDDLQGERHNDFPDRVLNPQNYRQQPPSPKVTVTKPTSKRTASKKPPEVSTENSYFLARRQRQELQAYGSIQTE